MTNMSTHEFALHACRKMLDKGAEGVRIMKLNEENCLFDYVILANGRSERQVTTLINEVYHFCKRHDQAYHPVEGDSGWKLIDCYAVIVHAFTDEMREYYDLDHLWSDVSDIDFEKELKKLADPDDAIVSE